MKSLVVSMVAVTLLLVGCGDEKSSAQTQPQAQQMPPLPVKAYEVKLAKAEFTKQYSAMLRE